MTRMESVQAFVSERTLAVVGVSRGGKKFGNSVYRTLKSQGYTVYPVHPEATSIEGDACYASLAALPEPVGGVFLCVPPAETEKLVDEAACAGIKRIWMQQGSASEVALAACAKEGLDVVHDECLLMYTAPTAFVHRAHKWVWKIAGKLPS